MWLIRKRRQSRRLAAALLCMEEQFRLGTEALERCQKAYREHARIYREQRTSDG